MKGNKSDQYYFTLKSLFRWSYKFYLLNLQCSSIAKWCSYHSHLVFKILRKLGTCIFWWCFFSFEIACGHISAKMQSSLICVSNQFTDASSLLQHFLFGCRSSTENSTSTFLSLKPVSSCRGCFFVVVVVVTHISGVCAYMCLREYRTLSCLTTAIIGTLSRQIINNPSKFMIYLILFAAFLNVFIEIKDWN